MTTGGVCVAVWARCRRLFETHKWTRQTWPRPITSQGAPRQTMMVWQL